MFDLHEEVPADGQQGQRDGQHEAEHEEDPADRPAPQADPEQVRLGQRAGEEAERWPRRTRTPAPPRSPGRGTAARGPGPSGRRPPPSGSRCRRAAAAPSGRSAGRRRGRRPRPVRERPACRRPAPRRRRRSRGRPSRDPSRPPRPSHPSFRSRGPKAPGSSSESRAADDLRAVADAEDLGVGAELVDHLPAGAAGGRRRGGRGVDDDGPDRGRRPARRPRRSRSARRRSSGRTRRSRRCSRRRSGRRRSGRRHRPGTRCTGNRRPPPPAAPRRSIPRSRRCSPCLPLASGPPQHTGRAGGAAKAQADSGWPASSSTPTRWQKSPNVSPAVPLGLEAGEDGRQLGDDLVERDVVLVTRR